MFYSIAFFYVEMSNLKKLQIIKSKRYFRSYNIKYRFQNRFSNYKIQKVLIYSFKIKYLFT